MPFRSGVPRTTHKWLAPLYNYLDSVLSSVVPSGGSGIANAAWVGKGVPITQLGNASGLVGNYGSSGIAGQLATGTAGITGFTGLAAGASGPANWWFNGGSGAFYTIGDVVTALKNNGTLKP